MKKILMGSLFIFLLFSCKAPEENGSIVDGVYDIANLAANEIAELKGDWTFIPNEFVDPKEDFSKYNRYEDMNEPWFEYDQEKYPPLPALGYATYAIKIKNLSPSGVYAIKIPNMSSASMFYLNGKEIYKSGQVSRSAKYEKLNWESAFIILPTSQLTEASLVIHISNFSYKNSVTGVPIRIGFYNALSSRHKQDLLNAIISSGLLLVIGIFFISLYIFYPTTKKPLFFGILCIVFSIRICSYDEFLLKSIIPSLSGDVVFKIGYLTLSIAIIFSTLFLNEFFVGVKKRILGIVLLPAFVYILINIFATPLLSSQLLIYAQVYLLFMGLYNLLIVVIGALRKDRSAYLFLVGLLIFIVVSVIDILISNRIINGIFIAHLGVFALLIPMAILVLQNFKIISDKLIAVTNEIETTNETLAKFVPKEFMEFLNKKHFDIKLGDNVLKDMYISFIHLGISSSLETPKDRLNFLEIYNKTLADINPVIEKHNGFIDKYLSEGLMVLFYGTANEVVDCMLEIKEYIRANNIERRIESLPLIHLACGIHYGKTMLGTIGEERRMDSTVISDAVNVASRLHLYAIKKNIDIFISGAVKEKITKDFLNQNDIRELNFRYVGLVRFRGKEEPIPVYEVKNDKK